MGKACHPFPLPKLNSKIQDLYLPEATNYRISTAWKLILKSGRTIIDSPPIPPANTPTPLPGNLSLPLKDGHFWPA